MKLQLIRIVNSGKANENGNCILFGIIKCIEENRGKITVV